MTQPTFEGIPLADKDNVFLLFVEPTRWKLGYVFNNDFYLHAFVMRGTYNKARDEVIKYVTDGLPIPDWNSRWEQVHSNNLLDSQIFNYSTNLQISVAEMRQAKAIALIKSQTVIEQSDEAFQQRNEAGTVLGKSDQEIIDDIQAGVIKHHTAPDQMFDLTRVTSTPKIVDSLLVEMEEPPIMAAGALADADLLNTNIGLPSDLLRAAQWPAYWKFIPAGWSAIDTYRIGALFPVDDPSGRIIHARKKLLVPGVRTGGKSMFKDIKEARDTLTQWLEDNPE